MVGWSNYRSCVVAKDVFNRMDYVLFSQLWRWARRRHPNKGARWVRGRYWMREGNRSWVFGQRDEAVLRQHVATPIRRHRIVRTDASVYDGNLVYWATRMGRHPELSTREALLLRRQHGRCAHCGLYFRDGDLLEVDHITPKHLGGVDAYHNWQLLHGHCHDQKTSADATAARR